MRRAVLILGAAVLVCGASLQPAEAEPAASRVIDRTFVCITVLQAGIRKISVSASAAAPGQTDVLGRRPGRSQRS